MPTKSRKGFALATVLVLLGVALFGVGALVSVSSLEAKIARSQGEGLAAYYVADSGMADAVWRLNNDATYKTALLNGTLNASYTAQNVPASGQSFIVTMQTSAQGAGYATVVVEASADNGTFVAQRRLVTEVFASAPQQVNPIGETAALSGGSLSISNGSGAANLNNGNLFSRGSISVHRTTVNLGTYKVKARGNYSVSSATVNSGGIEAANFPPQPADLPVPGVDFAYYQQNATVTYSSNQFINAIRNGGTNINFPGPITYVNGNVTLNSNVRNKNITITGLLVFSGNFSITSAADNVSVNLNNPGNDQSGIFSAGNMSLSDGTYNLNGVIYAAGSLSLSGIPSFTLNGGMLSAGSMTITTGASFNLNTQTQYYAVLFGSGGPRAIQVSHWEEEY